MGRRAPKQSPAEPPAPEAGVRWSDVLPVLATVPDTVLAQRLGVSKQRVAQIRKREGITAFARRSRRRAIKIDWGKADWSRTDQQIARDIGTYASCVRRARIRAGAPASPVARPRKLDLAATLRIQQERASGASLRELAARYGISESMASMVSRGLVWRGYTLDKKVLAVLRANRGEQTAPVEVALAIYGRATPNLRATVSAVLAGLREQGLVRRVGFARWEADSAIAQRVIDPGLESVERDIGAYRVVVRLEG
mgnify:CR=1 FL=1